MKYNLINFPVYYDRDKYQTAIDKAVEIISGEKSVKTIYNFGKIRNPGISDADILVVFEDNQSCNLNLLAQIGGNNRYYFTHTQLGMPESMLQQIYKYQLHVSLDLIYGQAVSFHKVNHTDEERLLLQKQIALEYMVNACLKNYRIRYDGTIKVRSLLLEAFAIRHDLKWLGITSGKLFDLIEQVVLWRNTWFENKPSNNEIVNWFENYCVELEESLKNIFSTYQFFIPKESLRYRDARILQSQKFFVSPLQFPSFIYKFLPVLPQKFIKKKVNMYNMYIPCKVAEPESFLAQRFSFLKECDSYNKKQLPHFYPFTTVMSILLQ